MAYARSCVSVLILAAAFAVAAPAQAGCTKLAFSVNDYGKEGPAKDAQALLDQYIARWAKEQGIKSFTTGKKTVSCELFLDVGLFDEYTCKATASVCWNGKPVAAPEAASESAPAKVPAVKVSSAKTPVKATTAPKAPAKAEEPTATPAPAKEK